MNYTSSLLPTPIESVVLVDEHDQVLGTAEKLTAHKDALLHRAFSIFIFRWHNNQLELLLQQRATSKYHSGGLWTNSCCGHPRENEPTVDAAKRRLFEEMGLRTDLNYVDTFIYKADVTCGLTEHEYDHVFYQIVPADIAFTVNPQEVADIKWFNINALHADYAANSYHYTVWFKQAFDIMCLHLPRLMISNQNPRDNVNA